MSIPAQTTGLGVAAKIAVAGTGNNGSTTPGYNGVTLSLSGANSLPETFQLNPVIEDAGGNVISPGTAFVLSAVANSSGNTAVYTGTITGGDTNAFAGLTFVVAGFTTAANNGDFIATASSSTTLTLENANAVAQSHAATATSQEIVGGNKLTYFSDGAASYTGGTSIIPANAVSEQVVTVSDDGALSANGVTGTSTVEVSYPAFNNASGATGAISPNPMTGLPLNKVYADVTVTVVP
jgi:hypothetical protein